MHAQAPWAMGSRLQPAWFTDYTLLCMKLEHIWNTHLWVWWYLQQWLYRRIRCLRLSVPWLNILDTYSRFLQTHQTLWQQSPGGTVRRRWWGTRVARISWVQCHAAQGDSGGPCGSREAAVTADTSESFDKKYVSLISDCQGNIWSNVYMYILMNKSTISML